MSAAAAPAPAAASKKRKKRKEHASFIPAAQEASPSKDKPDYPTVYARREADVTSAPKLKQKRKKKTPRAKTGGLFNPILTDPVCDSTRCTLACCNAITHLAPVVRQALFVCSRQRCRDATNKGGKELDAYLQCGMTMTVLGEADDKEWLRRRKTYIKNHGGQGPHPQCKSGCGWCNTVPGLTEEERAHTQSTNRGPGCPRQEQAQAWKRNNPSTRFTYSVSRGGGSGGEDA